MKNEDIPIVNQKADQLPNKLVIAPGTYSIDGEAYSFSENGVYRSFCGQQGQIQRIVWNGETSLKAIDDLMSSICWIMYHGRKDENLKNEELSTIATNRKINVSCGRGALWVKEVLEQLKVPSRVVTVLTMDEWNDYDNGHTMIEVWCEDMHQWIVYDIDNNVTFGFQGERLNLLSLSSHIKTDDYVIYRLATDVGYSGDDDDYTFWFEKILHDEMSLRDWYKRVIQVVLVGDDNVYYFSDIANRNRVESYAGNYKFMPYDKFMEKFY